MAREPDLAITHHQPIQGVSRVQVYLATQPPKSGAKQQGSPQVVAGLWVFRSCGKQQGQLGQDSRSQRGDRFGAE